VIKINLLESVTDRPAGVAFVEDKVSSTRTQTFLLALTVMALLVLGMGYDYVSANAQHETATRELEKQRRINEQMNAVKREQADLEKKIAELTNDQVASALRRHLHPEALVIVTAGDFEPKTAAVSP